VENAAPARNRWFLAAHNAFVLRAYDTPRVSLPGDGRYVICDPHARVDKGACGQVRPANCQTT